jgi:hypothetical protein
MKNFKSKKIIFITLCFFIFLGVTKAYAQDEKVLSLFEKKVANFEKFFSSNPKLLEKQSYSESPTGYIYFYQRFDDYKISYDVKKSDSIVSPYMGYIILSYIETNSQNCGDLKGFGSREGTDKYFTTEELVRSIKNDKSCYRPLIVGRVKVERISKFIFAFQKKQWVYIDVINEDNKPNVIFYMAFGKPFDVRYYVKDNDFWNNLIK